MESQGTGAGGGGEGAGGKAILVNKAKNIE